MLSCQHVNLAATPLPAPLLRIGRGILSLGVGLHPIPAPEVHPRELRPLGLGFGGGAQVWLLGHGG